MPKRKPNKRTKEPLEDGELDLLMARAAVEGGDTLMAASFLRWSGMHVSVLAEPLRYDLRAYEENRTVILRWDRPKKEGRDAVITVFLGRDVMHLPWREWVEELRGRAGAKSPRRMSRQYWYGVIRALGESVGMSGLSPLSFRHTYAVWLLNQGASVYFLCHVMGINRRTAETYARYTKATAEPMWKKVWGE